MTQLNKFSTLLAALFFVSFNLNAAEINDGLSDKHFAHPPTGGATDNKPVMSAAMMQPEGPTVQGKVMEITSASGYTYLRLEEAGEKFWVAATQVNANVGDVVSYIENVTMHDFTSKSLNKTFESIVFASTVKVVQ